MILVSMIVPSRTDTYVGLRRNPMSAVLLTASPFVKIRHPGIDRIPHQIGPGGFVSKAVFISHPADIRSGVTEHHCSGLEFSDEFVGGWPVVIAELVHFSLFIGTTVPAGTSISPVKPDLIDFPIIGQQFGQLISHVSDVFGLSVVRMIAIPRGIIDPDFQSIFPAGIHKLPDQITISVPPWAVFHRMLGVGRWPKYKPVVVLGSDDESFHPGFFGDTGPLPGIKLSWVKLFRFFVSKSPFPIRKSIHVEMDKTIKLQLLPRNLSLGGDGQNWFRACCFFLTKTKSKG